jgi:hypothetical protein
MAAGKLYNHRERRAHPPLGAGAGVDHGVDVVITGSHGNRTAPSGWMMRLVEQSRMAAIVFMKIVRVIQS